MTSMRRVCSLCVCVAVVIPSPTSCIISFVVGAPNYDSVWLMRVRLRCDKVVRDSKRARRSHRLSLLLSNPETREGIYSQLAIYAVGDEAFGWPQDEPHPAETD